MCIDNCLLALSAEEIKEFEIFDPLSFKTSACSTSHTFCSHSLLLVIWRQYNQKVVQLRESLKLINILNTLRKIIQQSLRITFSNLRSYHYDYSSYCMHNLGFNLYLGLSSTWFTTISSDYSLCEDWCVLFVNISEHN